MQIYLNGEAQQTTHTTLLQLIQALDLEGKRFAVEQNEKIIAKSKRWARLKRKEIEKEGQ